MTEKEDQNPDAISVGGHSLADWEKRWELVPQGFSTPQPRLRHQIGIFGAKDGDRFMYIGKAANMRGSGLSGGLSRAYVKNASGDKGGGLAMLKAHLKDLQVYVIKLPRSYENIDIVNLLGSAMVRAHRPIWNQSVKKIREAREAAYTKG